MIPKVPSGLFTVVRPESNITIIPRKYVDELANLPDDVLASNEAIVNVGCAILIFKELR